MHASDDTTRNESSTNADPAGPATDSAVQWETVAPATESQPTAGAESDLAELKDRHARLAAEFDNYRKRVLRERAELEVAVQAKLIGRLLDSMDDLDRAAASDPATTPPDAVRGALDVAHRKLTKELAAAGLERIDPAGSAFDPARHEAVSVIAPPTPAQDHQVSATFQVGYALKGVLIRPARVQVYSSEGLG